MPAPQDTFWKTKLAAFLHDPPSKCVDLRRHEQAARTLYRQAGFVDPVWEFCEQDGMIPADEAGFTAAQRRPRFDRQIHQFLSLSWQATPWPDSVAAAMKLAEEFTPDMPIRKAAGRVQAIIDYATKTIPESDTDFADTESTYGTGIDLSTGTVEESKFYSASYLRLREGWRLGTFATAPDKDFSDSKGNNDLFTALLNGQGGQILVGGQQRACSAIRDASIRDRLPLPLGKTAGFLASPSGKHRVKWILLTPAIWPEIEANPQKGDHRPPRRLVTQLDS